MRAAGWFTAIAFLLVVFSSCGKFDPLHPYDTAPVDTSITWQKTFGGSGDDFAYSVQQTSDGGFIIVGDTSSYGAGGSDVWLIKTDASGAVEWSKTFGGTGDDSGRCVVQTQDGGYVIAGSTTSFGHGLADVYVIKTDGNGNEQWHATYGGTSNDDGAAVTCTGDGGYAIVGTSSSFGGVTSAYLIKTDSKGGEEWQQTYSEGLQILGRCVRQTADGGYIIAGEVTPSDPLDTDAYLLKTDTSGNKTWSMRYGREFLDSATWIEPTPDGGYAFSGYTHSYGAGDFNAWLVKTDSMGNAQGNGATFGLNADDRAEHVLPTPDGGFVLAGMTKSYEGWEQAWLVKTDATGVLQWDKRFGGNGDEWGYCVALTSDGGYVMTGSTDPARSGVRDVYLIYYKP